ncbi:MAG: amino acid adenylation domain-containing protein [Candidatus Harrisonbacteria bacterium]|nr:amino acid adenylation domain-containing protein [Candidatus Harrisonbacteria bacterium]
MVKLIQDYFSISAKNDPGKLAVDVGEDALSEKEKEVFNKSFGWIDNFSNQFARYLKEKSVKRGDRVAFIFKKQNLSYSIASILAILKCDAIYVPIHYKLPPKRIIKILSDSDAKFLICSSLFAKDLKKHAVLSNFPFFEIDKEKINIEKRGAGALSYANNSDDAAYIMYTSGSTGNPKGVVITHGNIINATEWAVEEFGITSEDRMSQHPPLNFDLSTFDLYCAFKSGASLHPVPEDASIFPGELVRFIENNKLTIWNSVPSVMVQMAVAGLVKPDRMPTLKKIFFNGEGFPTKFLAEWMKIYPDKEFVNMYGPTETTVQCTFYRVHEPPKDLTRLVPIGKACHNVEVFDVDGELYVGGLGVGRGYWNDPQRTSELFINYPGRGRVYKTGDLVRLLPDGNYEFIGRRDNQVKIHGNRIELGDIESAINSLPYIREAGVIAVTASEIEDKKVIAFVSVNEDKKPESLKSDLKKLLPLYMIPQQIEIRDSLPKTGNGKIDRVKLKNEYGREN